MTRRVLTILVSGVWGLGIFGKAQSRRIHRPRQRFREELNSGCAFGGMLIFPPPGSDRSLYDKVDVSFFSRIS